MRTSSLSLRLLAGALAIPALACIASVSCSHTGTGGTAGTGASSTGTGGASGTPGPVARHSSSIAVSPDGTKVYVVNADADSVSEIDTVGRTLLREIPIASPPAVDDAGRYTAAVQPRALALSPRAGMLYVTGERSGMLHGIDLASGKVTVNITVGSEPIGVLVAPDESAVYVACSNDATVVRVDPVKGAVTGTLALTDGTSSTGVPIPAEPWALAWSIDSKTLYATHMLAPNVSAIDAASFTLASTLSIPDLAANPSSPLIANGTARGLYDVVARPGTSGEVWAAHLMLAITTPQPTLDFESTAFPTLSVFGSTGAFASRMTTNASTVSNTNGQFANIVSGPHALEFTADGNWALMLDSASEDILAIDANGKVEAANGLLHPLYQDKTSAGHMQEGLVLSPDGKFAYVDERNTWSAGQTNSGGDVAIIGVDTSGGTITLSIAAPPIPRLSTDPMPTAMRHGQFLFNTANNDFVPITQNHWIACATCHVEGRTDAVTWRFLEGPRDTPSNAGGVTQTGFLLRTADRRAVTDYWQTIDDEQGGSFSSPSPDGGKMETTFQAFVEDLQDLQMYVNFAIPLPVPPTTDPALVAMGAAIFNSADVGCRSCHSGLAFTDSGEANPSLILEDKVLLHDVGSCNTGVFPDVNHTDEDGNPRYPCAVPAGGVCADPTDCVGFDTPTLRGVASSAPYLHDGSAPTIRDVLIKLKGSADGVTGAGHMGDITGLTDAQIDALVEYVRSL